MDDEQERKYAANLQYLADHGLAESQISIGIDGHMSFGPPRITHRGLDFLADDGGLGAVLNTLTVKFDARQLAEMLATRVEALPSGTAEERATLATAIRALPAKALETLSTKILAWGIASAADALPFIQNLLHKLAA